MYCFCRPSKYLSFVKLVNLPIELQNKIFKGPVVFLYAGGQQPVRRRLHKVGGHAVLLLPVLHPGAEHRAARVLRLAQKAGRPIYW